MILASILIAAAASAPVDPRYCGPPARTASGVIVRSAAVRAAFRRNVPCPSTGLTTGACPGWAMDHVWPLDACGCDSVGNLQWLPWSIKASSAPDAKDRWERKVYRCAEAAAPAASPASAP